MENVLRTPAPEYDTAVLGPFLAGSVLNLYYENSAAPLSSRKNNLLAERDARIPCNNVTERENPHTDGRYEITPLLAPRILPA